MTETEQTTKPLPCPFCGAEKITIAEGSTYRWAHATCVECGAAAGDIRREYPQGTDDPEVQEAAIAEWNVRDTRELDALTAQLRTANAEVARLMPLSEIYTLWKKIIEDGNPSRDTVAHFVELAHEAAERAAAAPKDLRTPTDQRIAALEAQLAKARAQIYIMTGNAADHEAKIDAPKADNRFLLRRGRWPAWGKRVAVADLSVLDVIIKRMSTEWTPVSEALPKSGMPVLAWNGEPHLATWTARYTVEDYLDDESWMAECDDRDNWWMREGWYVQIVTEKARAQGYDFIIAMIESPPITHWMLLPAPPEASK